MFSGSTSEPVFPRIHKRFGAPDRNRTDDLILTMEKGREGREILACRRRERSVPVLVRSEPTPDHDRFRGKEQTQETTPGRHAQGARWNSPSAEMDRGAHSPSEVTRPIGRTE